MRSELNILHIARLENRPQSGVANVVPNYLYYQSSFANVALLNIRNFVPPNSIDRYPVYIHSNKNSSLVGDINSKFNSPDLVVFHEVYWKEYLSISSFCRKNNIPYIVVPHVSLTDTAQHKKRIKKLIGNALFFNKFINGAEAIQFLSESEKNQTSKYRTKYNFIRSNGINIVGKKKQIFSKKALKLIYVGRFDFKIKGIDRILEAFNIIQNEARIQNISVSLFGPSNTPGFKKIQQLIKNYAIEDLVTLGSGLFGDEKISKIVESDMFIQLSRTEGQPLGIMEAMDIGMPCMVTKGTTFYEIVRDNNSGIPVSDDPKEISESLLNVRNNIDSLKQLSEKSSIYASKNFDWSRLAPLMIDDYRLLLKNRAE